MKRLFLLLKNPFVIAFFFGILSLHWVKEYSKARRSAPEPWVIVGPWQLTNQNGQPLGSKNLEGKVVIMSYFFSRCPTVCPKLMNGMNEIKKRFDHLRDKSAFVSISVDPDYDIPERLLEYKIKNGYDWEFLTGTQDEITQVVENQMKFSISSAHHLAELALFDQDGNLRGKFSTDPTGLASLEKAAKFLIETFPY